MNDAYGRRQKRKRQSGQGCAVLVIAFVLGAAAIAGVLVGGSHLLSVDTIVHIEGLIGG